jgi:ATP synthase protein I
MSQDSLMTNPHRTRVPSSAADPAARTGKRAYNALSASSVGVEIGLSVGIGLLIGYYMDNWLGTQPWLMFLWLVFGLIAGFRGVMRAVREADRAAETESKQGGGNGDA